MSVEVGRRVFVGAVAAGLPLVAVGSFAQSRPGPLPGDALAQDNFMEHVARQLAAIHNRARQRGYPIGEDNRLIAAHLRTLSVYGKQTGLDARVRQSMQDLVKRRGKDSVLFDTPDRGRLRSQLRHYGVEPDERLLDRFTDNDYDTRSKALDTLLGAGITAQLDRLADVAEHVASRLDAQAGRVALVGLQDAAYWAGYCAQLNREIAAASVMAAMCQAAAYLWALLEPGCIAYGLGGAVLAAAYVLYC
jgi:hypothetical protein